MKLKRRHVLGGGAAVAVVAATGINLATAQFPDGIAAFVRKTFPGMRMDPAQLDDFARQMADRWVMADLKKRAFGAMLESAPYEWIGRQLIADRLRLAKSEIVAMFLRSTDFLDPARGDAAVSFVMLAKPYEAGCSNPIPMWTASEAKWPDGIA